MKTSYETLNGKTWENETDANEHEYSLFLLWTSSMPFLSAALEMLNVEHKGRVNELLYKGFQKLEYIQDQGTVSKIHLRNFFTHNLERKTGWGRVEVLREFDAAMTEASVILPSDDDTPF